MDKISVKVWKLLSLKLFHVSSGLNHTPSLSCLSPIPSFSLISFWHLFYILFFFFFLSGSWVLYMQPQSAVLSGSLLLKQPFLVTVDKIHSCFFWAVCPVSCLCLLFSSVEDNERIWQVLLVTQMESVWGGVQTLPALCWPEQLTSLVGVADHTPFPLGGKGGNCLTFVCISRAFGVAN